MSTVNIFAHGKAPIFPGLAAMTEPAVELTFLQAAESFVSFRMGLVK
jgi:hypothetical protein